MEISSEIKRKRTNVPMGELRLSGRTMIDKEIIDMARKIENVGIYLALVSQLDKLARHNRQGSFRTKERYYEAMKRFCAYLADEFHLQKLENISGKHLTAYVLWMQESGKSPSTIKTDLAAIRFFHDKMSNPKYRLPTNDELAVELERRCFGGTDRTWSNTEFNKMLGKALAIDRYDFILALYLARYAGLRIHECFRIDTATAELSVRTPSPSRARAARCELSPSMSKSPSPCGSCWSAPHGDISCWCPMTCPQTGPSTTCNSSL